MRKKGFRLAVFVLMAALFVSMSACNDKSSDKGVFTLPSTDTVAVGETKIITLNNTTDISGTVIWSSNNTAVASIDSTGRLTGVAQGTAIISAILGTNVSTCTVTVTGGTGTALSIPTSKSITVGSSVTLTATNTTGSAITWSSSNTSVATVDGSGKVTAVAAGSCSVVASAGGKTATCAITVTSGSGGGGAISTTAEFLAVKDNLSGSYYLTNDIDFSGAAIDPIGIWSGSEATNSFKGTFDGKGYAVKNFTLNSSKNTVPSGGTFGVALFTYIGQGGTVKNLGVIGGTASGDGFVGAIAGKNSGTISNCYIEVSIGYTANTTNWGVYSGSIAGINNTGATVSGCLVKSSITSWGGVFHLVGCNWGSITNCYAISAGFTAELNAASRYNGDTQQTEVLIPATSSSIIDLANSTKASSYANLSTAAWSINEGSIPALIKS